MDEPEAPSRALDPASTIAPPIPTQPAVHLLAESIAARPGRESRPVTLNDDRQADSTTTTPWDFYNSAQWTADGTSLLVGSSEHVVSAFVLPSDLLESPVSLSLETQAVTKLPEPTQVIAGAPYFSLAEPTTQTFLAACRDHPIQLYHIFPNDSHAVPLSSYKLIRKETEAYVTPSSLIWQYPGTHFICGSMNRLDYFDMSRHASDGPVLTIPTIPSKRHIAKGSGVGMKGTVAALAASPPDTNGSSIVAAGTWTRWIGLYDLQRTDRAVAQWSVTSNNDMDEATEIGGQGIVQVLWSPCGRYLIVNERQSEGLLVYDIRGTGQLLSVLKGRKATTQQKLNCDVFQGDPYSGSSSEVWAGSQDGTVTVWEDVGVHDGGAEPTWSWKAQDSPIGSTIIHSSGSVVATCSGGWATPSLRDMADEFGHVGTLSSSQRVFDESSVKIWSISTPQDSSEAR